MKTINELETKIEPIDGESSETPTYRKIIQLVISQSKTRTADDARRVTRIVAKIRKASDAELSDEEFKVLKELVEGNQANLAGYVQGVLLEKIDPSPRS